MKVNNTKVYLGVDGCRGGWVAAILSNGILSLERFDTIRSLVKAYPEFDAFLIDMVIGLRSNSMQIRPDDLARKALKGHSSTVFPTPCRQAVYAETEEDKKKANIVTLGKSLPKQTINIIPKIKELDEFLEEHSEYKNRILESHPELAFARLKGSALDSNKKGYIGYLERMYILERYLPECTLPDFRDRAKELKCNPDDLLDAVCLAVTASMSAHNLCETIPSNPEQDDRGLYMQITIPKEDSIVPMTERKVAVVTGGAHGIGKTIADEFYRQGVKVYVIDKSTEGNHYVGDISDRAVLEAFAEKVIGECGRIDYPVNNALPVMKGIDECSYEEFQYALSVGVTAPFYLSKLFAPYFSKGGSIINISSSRDRMSQPQTESYTAAKGGIAALTHALAVSLSGKVRVNSISPGWIDTEYREYEGADALQQPAGRVGNPMDIANLVMFLCSEKAGFITGENICVDGGMTKLMVYHDDHGWTYEPEKQ
ncbi:MAG: SDR family oxidoreductase [Lachnospiraceae bacterium]|nr:SDR family oxidoreductase [Lachnospiraceae bacterium]